MNRLALKNGKIYVERDVFAQAVLMENGRVTAVVFCTEAPRVS